MLITYMLLTVAAFSLSLFITGLMKRYAQRADLLDVPNYRSSHRVATPRGGGLSFVLVFLVSVVGLYLVGGLSTAFLFSLLIGGALIAGIGFMDDHQHVPALWRFLVQVAAASFAVEMCGGLPILQIGNRLVDLGVSGDVAAIVFTVWLINLYNFMDGIDGIAAVEAICVVGGALAISSGIDAGESARSLLVVFVAAVSGFLVWNWPPAKIFMGDVGSGFIGFVLAIFAIISSKQGLLPIWCWLILAGVFVVDSTVTLITRVINGEQWYAAHNNHAYQKASRRLDGHQPVTLLVLGINVLWLLPIAWLASLWPENGWWLTVIAWLPLISLALFLKAGHPEAGV